MSSVVPILLAFVLSSGWACAEKKLDVTYGTAAGEELKLDLFVPEGPGPFPVCILVHGPKQTKEQGKEGCRQEAGDPDRRIGTNEKPK